MGNEDVNGGWDRQRHLLCQRPVETLTHGHVLSYLVGFCSDTCNLGGGTGFVFGLDWWAGDEVAGVYGGVGRRGAQVANLFFQLADSDAEHLIFASQVGGFGLVEGTFVSEAVSPSLGVDGRGWVVECGGSLVPHWIGAVEIGGSTGTGAVVRKRDASGMRNGGDGGVDGRKGDGALGSGSEVVDDCCVGCGGGVVLGRPSRGLFLLVAESVILRLLFPDHQQHSVDLHLLFLLQSIMNVSEAGLSLVVGVTGCYCGSSTDGRRAGGRKEVGEPVGHVGSGITAGQFARTGDGRVIEIEVHGNLRSTTVARHTTQSGRASIADGGSSRLVCGIEGGGGSKTDGGAGRRGVLSVWGRGDAGDGLHGSRSHG